MRSLRPLPRDGFFFEEEAPNPPPPPNPAPLLADFFVACNDDVRIDGRDARWRLNVETPTFSSGAERRTAQIATIEYIVARLLASQ